MSESELILESIEDIDLEYGYEPDDDDDDNSDQIRRQTRVLPHYIRSPGGRRFQNYIDSPTTSESYFESNSTNSESESYVSELDEPGETSIEMAQLSVTQHINLANRSPSNLANRSQSNLTNRECSTCLICLENLSNEPNEWKITSFGCNCQINYHIDCFITWYSMNRTCPICHTRLNRNSIYIFNDLGNNFNYGDLVQRYSRPLRRRNEMIYAEPEQNYFVDNKPFYILIGFIFIIFLGVIYYLLSGYIIVT